MECPLPPAPVLTLPPDQASSIGQPVVFDWEGVPNALEYRLQVDIDAAFADPVIDQTRPVSDAFTTGLSAGTTYHWRARARDDCGWGNWSDSWSFTP